MSEKKDESSWGLAIGAALGAVGALYAGYKGLQMLTENTTPPTSNTNFSLQNIYIISDDDDCKTAALRLKRGCNYTKCLGFDILWTNNTGNRREEVGLLQLATCDGYCALIRLCYLRGNIPTELKDILKDDTILKVGVGSHRDAIFLSEDYGIKIDGTLDLSELADYAECGSRGLLSLASELLGMDIKEPQSPNWEKVRLTDAEISYASDVAIACIKIYQAMQQKIVSRLDNDRFTIIQQNLKH